MARALESTVTPRTAAAARAGFDWGLLAIVSAMLIYGLIMVFSASYPISVDGSDHPFLFVGRQLQWLAVGAVVMITVARIPYTLYQQWAVPIFAATMVTLAVLLVIGNDLFGSTRTFIGGSIQPSQPAKMAIVIYVATWLASKGTRIREVRAGLIPFAVLLGFVTLLIFFQPSISTAVLIVVTSVVMFFLAGAAVGQIIFILVLGTAVFWFAITSSAYAPQRIAKYIESIWNPLQSTEHQVQQSVQAMTTGGPIGVGIGQGTGQQHGFVPLAWTDNIYAIIGQELGFIGTLLVILLFTLLVYRGLQIAMRCRDPFGMLLALGITVMLATQALLNMAVVVAIVPPTGVPLPFFSYGGSSLVTAMAAIGILFSVSRYGRATGRVPVRGRSAPSTQPAGTRLESNASIDLGGRNRRSRLSGTGGSGTARTSSRKPASPKRESRFG